MFDPGETTIAALQELMGRGELTAALLVRAYLARIARFDREGPALHAVLEINPDALFLAEAMDRERGRGRIRGPLHGIPILLKDNIDTGDKMHTSAGSLALAGRYAARDAYLVRRLRRAGAVILGKTNMTEYANYMADGMPSGYSSRGGQVKSPYDPDLDPSGSSSGSAVAVAANFCAAAVGTETDGSITSPARNNQIVGLKPTVGLISRAGIIPISHSQDTAGPMATSVADAAILLGPMTGADPSDPATWRSRGEAPVDYTASLRPDGLQGARIALCTSDYGGMPAADRERLAWIAAVLQAGGAEVSSCDKIFDADQNSSVLRHEFKSGLNYYLARAGAGQGSGSLEEVIAFNRAHGEAALRYGQAVLERSQATSGTLTEPAYLLDRLKDLQSMREDGIDRLLAEKRLDALAFLEGTSIAAVAGYPSLIVPAGLDGEGKPCGLTLIGGAFQEPVLLRLGYAFEQATRARVAPKLD